MGNRKAINVAKYNAERFYSVIGITELLELSIAVMEQFLPRFFKGAKLIKNAKLTPNKKPLSSAAKIRLTQKLGMDMEFYDFAYQRLLKQAKAF